LVFVGTQTRPAFPFPPLGIVAFAIPAPPPFFSFLLQKGLSFCCPFPRRYSRKVPPNPPFLPPKAGGPPLSLTGKERAESIPPPPPPPMIKLIVSPPSKGKDSFFFFSVENKHFFSFMGDERIDGRIIFLKNSFGPFRAIRPPNLLPERS